MYLQTLILYSKTYDLSIGNIRIDGQKLQKNAERILKKHSRKAL